MKRDEKRPRLVAAVPVDPPRKPTRTRKLKQHKEIQAWQRHAEKSAETGDRERKSDYDDRSAYSAAKPTTHGGSAHAHCGGRLPDDPRHAGVAVADHIVRVLTPKRVQHGTARSPGSRRR